MVSWPLERIGEVLIDGRWVELPLRESTRISITRGYGTESSTARPGTASVRVNDPDGALSPYNAEGDLHDRWGRGTSFRFRVGDVPDTPAPVMVDAFDRTAANGWGISTSGVPWVIWDPFGSSPPPAEFSVSGGEGRITTSTKNASRLIITSGLPLGDFEATYTVATSVLPQDNNTEEGILATFLARVTPGVVTAYLCNVWLLPTTGLPSGAGLRVAANIANESASAATAFQQIPGLTYGAGTRLRVRVRCEGPELRMRVWADGTPEPDHWHAQLHDTGYTTGEVGFRTSIQGDNTVTPATLSFGDLQVRPLTADAGAVRLVGEVDNIEPYEDENGDGYLDLDVTGVLRRYDGPQKTIASAMRRRISLYGAQAYWAMEEGAQGDTYIAQVGEGSTAGPLRAAGLDFARENTLVGSGALPTVQAGGTLRSTGIPGIPTGYWAVYIMVKLTTSGFPTDAAKHEILKWSTGTATLTLSAQLSGGNRTLVLDATGTDGTSLGSNFLSHDAIKAIGRPGFLDRWQQIRLYCEPSGAQLVFGLALHDPDGPFRFATIGPLALAADRVRSINTVFGAGVQGMGIGHVSVWGVVGTTSYSWIGSGQRQVSELGVPGLTARAWLSSLACDQGLALDVTGPAAIPLGPYYQAPVMNLVQAAADTDTGLLVETRDRVGLAYLGHETLYHKPVDLVLDYASGLVFAPFQPKDDGLGFANKVTAKRRDGSEATAELTAGRQSTRPFPDGVGVQDIAPEVIVSRDDQLPDQAGWRLHLGTWDRMRVAGITLKMANSRLHNLLDTVLTLREGSRVQVVNTPRRYGPDGFDLLVRGTKEVHGEGVFDLTLTCTPYGPYAAVGMMPAWEDFEDTVYEIPYANGGTLPWTRTNLRSHTGSWSLRAGAITNNQTSDAVFTVPVWATEMRVWYRTSSEPAGPGFVGDRLLVLVDSAQVLSAQGEAPWAQAIIPVAGASTVTFRYVKDNSASAGEDTAYIDNLSFTGRGPSKADTDGSQLAADADATATSLTVVTPTGQPWANSAQHAADFPFEIRVQGEVMTVTAITGATSPQTMTVIRSVNGVIKKQSASTAVQLARPAVAGL
ncbi:hypothetical protein DF268_36045 [Streptomyces sp. V2]|uniref:hypothetical protein n=1 Tax=Streptomyces sp. V2 TaxID=1424099 RepID=UPI000D66F281|nr:hypothetical protein [Streptomyces sp. V2]PWG08784.1 hypothetical protein DF268_36045 [Streptomyces sp. V2]